jgi:hypothetical protein
MKFIFKMVKTSFCDICNWLMKQKLKPYKDFKNYG